jgi:hypothetical protein
MFMEDPSTLALRTVRVFGAQDATALLEREHAQLRDLLAELAEPSPGPGLGGKKGAFRAFKALLEIHALVEEEVFYPAVMRLRSEPARRSVKEALEEHQGLDSLIAEIDQIEPDEDEYDEKVELLRSVAERHFRGEEAAMFAEARNHLTDDRLEALGRQMLALREKLATETERQTAAD